MTTLLIFSLCAFGLSAICFGASLVLSARAQRDLAEAILLLNNSR